MNDVAFVAASAVTVTALLWWSTRLRAREQTTGATPMLTATALLSPAMLIEGADDIPVALSLHAGRVRYESADRDASIDVHDIDEVEYGSDLMTGAIAGGAMLRLRSHGRAFEFALDIATAERWSERLPPRR